MNIGNDVWGTGQWPSSSGAQPGTPYAVELLYPSAPSLDADRLAPRVRAFCPRVGATDVGGRPPVLFSHPDHLVTIDLISRHQDGSAAGAAPHDDRAPDDAQPAVPARTVVLPADRVTDVAALHQSLSQTRDWDAAADALARSTARVVVTDLMARDLPPRERLALFESVLLGVIEAARPAAIHWRPAGKLVDPAAFLRASGSSELDALPQAAINVRLFRVARTDRDLVMDTLGLAALGLPDLQVAFRGLDPARVAGHLYAIALYTLRHAGALAAGDVIEGPTEGSEWTAHDARAAVGPPRHVVGFDPGPDHSVRAA
ncbi:MAG: hypothetical protein JWO31_3241 [Phycisphaerales bacterium]|nr:hypothetical protein [Phycisphaerales bacterium]